MEGRTDRVIPIYPQNFVCGGYNNTGTGNQCWMSKVTVFGIHKVFKKRVLKKSLGTNNFCWMSQDVRKLRCQIAQVPLYYNFLISMPFVNNCVSWCNVQPSCI